VGLLVQVHPDNRLNWDLVVKCLADCRGEDNDDVILTGHNWMFKSRRDIDTNLALLNAAGRLRYQACELREYAEAVRARSLTHLSPHTPWSSPHPHPYTRHTAQHFLSVDTPPECP
jgi:hypothetical protein